MLTPTQKSGSTSMNTKVTDTMILKLERLGRGEIEIFEIQLNNENQQMRKLLELEQIRLLLELKRPERLH